MPFTCGMRSSLVLHILVFATAFLVQIALARWAESTAAFGNYAFHLSLAQSLAIVAGLGVPSAALRFISRHLAHAQENEARRLAMRSYRVVMGSAFSASGLLLLAVFLWSGEVSVGMWFAAAMLPLFSLRFMNETWAQTQQRMSLKLLPGGVIQPWLMLAAAGILAWKFAPGLSANQLLTIAVGSMLVCAVVQAWWLGISRIFGARAGPKWWV